MSTDVGGMTPILPHSLTSALDSLSTDISLFITMQTTSTPIVNPTMSIVNKNRALKMLVQRISRPVLS